MLCKTNERLTHSQPIEFSMKSKKKTKATIRLKRWAWIITYTKVCLSLENIFMSSRNDNNSNSRKKGNFDQHFIQNCMYYSTQKFAYDNPVKVVICKAYSVIVTRWIKTSYKNVRHAQIDGHYVRFVTLDRSFNLNGFRAIVKSALNQGPCNHQKIKLLTQCHPNK